MIEIKDASFSYPHHHQQALRNVTAAFRRASFTVLTGPTGCGKSTLLKCVSGIIPHRSKGLFAGTVHIGGTPSLEMSPSEISRHVGLVFQCPDDQIFATKVEAEVAFGPENHGLPHGEIKDRVTWALGEVGLAGFERRETKNLSGGQKQRVAIAAQLAMKPEVIALDEPVSQLDPAGAGDVLDCLKRLHAEGRTIILVEHRLGEALRLATDVILMRDGEIAWAGARDDSFRTGLYGKLGLQLPDPVVLNKHLSNNDTAVPWTPGSAAERIRNRIASVAAANKSPVMDSTTEKEVPVLSLHGIDFGYAKSAPALFSQLALDIRQGERVAVMGPNGGGKSTLLGLLAGLLKPWKGKAMRPPMERTGFLFQNPDLMLFCPTLAEEIRFGRWSRRLPLAEMASHVERVTEDLGVKDYLDRPTTSLSRGQRLRSALSVILCPEPDVLFLDEPTTGQDRENVNRMMDHLLELAHVEMLVFCTHDLSVAIDHATRLLLVKDGRIVADGTPRAVAHEHDALADCRLRLPFAHEVAHALDRDELGWMTMEELCAAIK